MELRVLGPFEVVDGARTVQLPRGRARSLLALLALHPREVLATDRLIAELWGPSPPPTATTALQGLVSTLRKRLEPHRDPGEKPTVIVTHPPGYVLAVDPDHVDASRFRRSVEIAAGAAARQRAEELRAALSLWRGPALADFAYEPFAQTPIAALDELRMVAVERRVAADLELGRHAEVVAELEEHVSAHPLREELRGHLMVALYRCGRQVEALGIYRDAREYLRDELGIEPGPRLQELERSILRHDPALAAPEPRPVDRRADASPVTSPWLPAARRTVTVAFIDLGATPPTAGRSTIAPEAARHVLEHAQGTVRSVVERHGGSVEGSVGDLVVAVFGLPIAHEDDAARAVRAAWELREAIVDFAEDAGQRAGPGRAPRVGISTGEVVVDGGSDPETATSGPPVTRATRLQQLAGDGELLVDAATRRLVQPIALLDPVPGARQDASAWRVRELVAPREGPVPTDTPHVGRAQEVAELLGHLDRVAARGRASLVTVLGAAGIGKSALARIFTQEVGTHVRSVLGRCRAYGQGITLWPLREIVRDLTAGADEHALTDLLPAEGAAPHAALIAAAVGLSDERVGRPAELFVAIRHLFEHAARDGPLVVVVEDVHWAEATFLDLLEYLADDTRAPVLLLCLARPDLLDQRSRWPDVRSATTLELGPLSAPDSRRLITARLAGHRLAPETMGRILAMAQGNPLFLEQLLAALREDDELTVPPTVQAVLTTRLDRLGPAERDLLRCASVVGVDVPVDALGALVPDDARGYLGQHLHALEAKDLIRPWPDERPGFDFSHVLIQQTAYRSLTLDARAELHEQLANWILAGSDAGRADAELVGHHLEQAVLHRRDLGRSDEHLEELAVRAGELLGAAGLRAYDRFDVPAAENLLSRARRLLPRGHPDRPGILRRLTEAYPVMGMPEEAEDAFSERLALTDRDRDDAAHRSVRLERIRFRLITGPDPLSLASIQREIDETLEACQRDGDVIGESQAHYVLARTHLMAGRIAALEAVAWRGVDRARRTGDMREQLGAPWWVVFAMLTGPNPVPACIRACGDVLHAGGLAHLGAMAALGLFEAMRGEIEEGRRLVARARKLLRERIRIPRPLAFIAQRQAEVELLAGDRDTAVQAYREALDVALQIRERDHASQIAAELSLAVARDGHGHDAARLATLAGEQAPAESVIAQVLSGAASARVALDAGDHRQAGARTRAALSRVPDDMLILRARLSLVLAEVAAAAGRDDEARAARDAAIGLHIQKGNVAGADRARQVVLPRR